MLKQPRLRFKGKNAFIRSLSCAAAGMHNIQCCEGLDEAHYKTGSYAGKNLKNDKLTIPMCRLHHATEGNLGERRFWGDKPVALLAQDLHDAWQANNRANAMLVVACFIQMPMVRG